MHATSRGRTWGKHTRHKRKPEGASSSGYTFATPDKGEQVYPLGVQPQMQLLGSENFPQVAVEALRSLAHNLLRAAENCPKPRNRALSIVKKPFDGTSDFVGTW